MNVTEIPLVHDHPYGDLNGFEFRSNGEVCALVAYDVSGALVSHIDFRKTESPIEMSLHLSHHLRHMRN